jgi:CheY-like chemotaxis protein
MAGPGRILIVEDDADLREAMTVMLESEGHQVSEAADGKSGLDALASGLSFAVIIIDLMMPVMDGATFLDHKARSAYADIPVVVFSSSSFDGVRGARVSSLVGKPDGIEALLAAIRHAQGDAPLPCARDRFGVEVQGGT